MKADSKTVKTLIDKVSSDFKSLTLYKGIDINSVGSYRYAGLTRGIWNAFLQNIQ